jgi:tRNA 2-selenouridine synthase SelU
MWLQDLHASKIADGLLLDVRSPPLSTLLVLNDVNFKP